MSVNRNVTVPCGSSAMRRLQRRGDGVFEREQAPGGTGRFEPRPGLREDRGRERIMLPVPARQGRTCDVRLDRAPQPPRPLVFAPLRGNTRGRGHTPDTAGAMTDTA